MADDSVIRITIVSDASGLVSGNQVAVASTDSAMNAIRLALEKAKLGYRLLEQEVKERAANLADAQSSLTGSFGTAAGAAPVLDYYKTELEGVLAKAAQARVQVSQLTAALKEQKALGSTGAADIVATNKTTASEEQSASSFEALATTGTAAVSAESQAAAWEALATAQTGAAASAQTLVDAQVENTAASEATTVATTEEASAWARLMGIENLGATGKTRLTVLDRAMLAIKQALGIATQTEATAEAGATAAKNASAEAAEKSAAAWAAYAGETAVATAAVEAEGTAEKSRSAATAGGIGPMRAASAELHILEGGLQGSTRGAAAFLTQTLDLGPVLQAAFPVFGLLAFGSILYEMVSKLHEFYENTVMLKGQIEAMGDASAKTAKEAAEANWKAIESQVELLKLQGKLAEAQQVEQAHAGERPEHISLGIDDKKLKEFPEDFQRMAKEIEHVNILTGEGAKAYDDIHKWILRLTDDLGKQKVAAQQAQDALNAQAENVGQNPESDSGGADAIVGLNVMAEAAQKRVQLTTDMLAAVTNLENKHTSDTLVQQWSDAGKSITLTEKEWSDKDEIARASAEKQKKLAEATATYQEEQAKHLLATGQITADREIELAAQAARGKMEAERVYYESRNASLAKDPNLSADSGKQAQLIANQGEIDALKKEGQAKDLAAEDAAMKERIRIQLDAIEEQKEAIRAQAANTIEEERRVNQQIVQLDQQAMSILAAQGLMRGEQHKEVMRMLSEDERKVSEDTVKMNRQAVDQQIEDIHRIAKEQEEAADAEERQAQARLATQRAQQEAALTQKSPGERAIQGTGIGTLYDIGKAQSQAEQRLQIVNNEEQRELALVNEAEASKALAIEKEKLALNEAALAGTISNEQYHKRYADLTAEEVKLSQDAATKKVQIEQKAAQDRIKIHEQMERQFDQIEQQMSRGMEREMDKMIFQTHSVGQAFHMLGTDIVRSMIESGVKMVAQMEAHEVKMLIIHQTTNQEKVASDATSSAQSEAISSTAAMKKIAKEAAQAAAGAYNAMADIPVVGPVLGAAAAAGTFAAVMAFGAFAEHGWDVPRGGPFPTMLHSEEMVLPAPLAHGVRQMVSSGGSGEGAGKGQTSNVTNQYRFSYSPTFHGNGAPPSARQQGEQVWGYVREKLDMMGMNVR